jgi:signal transduction histidine kinase
MSRGIYRMVRDLRPAQLDDLGLGAALRYLADDAMRRSGVRANLHFQGEQRRLDPLVETVILRVAQESLTKVIRHAQCDVCEMTIEFQEDFVKLSVKDEGVGFDPDLVGDPQRGLGIAGIRERVDSVGGKLVVDAQPSKGSLVTVTIPVNNNVEPIIEEQAHAYDKVDAS